MRDLGEREHHGHKPHHAESSHPGRQTLGEHAHGGGAHADGDHGDSLFHGRPWSRGEEGESEGEGDEAEEKDEHAHHAGHAHHEQGGGGDDDEEDKDGEPDIGNIADSGGDDEPLRLGDEKDEHEHADHPHEHHSEHEHGGEHEHGDEHKHEPAIVSFDEGDDHEGGEHHDEGEHAEHQLAGEHDEEHEGHEAEGGEEYSDHDGDLDAKLEPQGEGEELDPVIRHHLELETGFRLGGIRVHIGGAIGDTLREHGKAGAAKGKHVLLADGGNPHDARFRDLVRHEVNHVIQQSSGAVSAKLGKSERDKHEADADRPAHGRHDELKDLTPPSSGPAQFRPAYDGPPPKPTVSRPHRSPPKPPPRPVRAPPRPAPRPVYSKAFIQHHDPDYRPPAAVRHAPAPKRRSTFQPVVGDKHWNDKNLGAGHAPKKRHSNFQPVVGDKHWNDPNLRGASVENKVMEWRRKHAREIATTNARLRKMGGDPVQMGPKLTKRERKDLAAYHKSEILTLDGVEFARRVVAQQKAEAARLKAEAEKKKHKGGGLLGGVGHFIGGAAHTVGHVASGAAHVTLGAAGHIPGPIGSSAKAADAGVFLLDGNTAKAKQRIEESFKAAVPGADFLLKHQKFARKVAHFALDATSYVPGPVGAGASAADAGLYLAEGNKKKALQKLAEGAVGLIPIPGSKMAGKVVLRGAAKGAEKIGAKKAEGAAAKRVIEAARKAHVRIHNHPEKVMEGAREIYKEAVKEHIKAGAGALINGTDYNPLTTSIGAATSIIAGRKLKIGNGHSLSSHAGKKGSDLGKKLRLGRTGRKRLGDAGRKAGEGAPSAPSKMVATKGVEKGAEKLHGEEEEKDKDKHKHKHHP